MPHAASILLAIAVTVGAAWLGLTRTLGAHPMWEVQVALIGAPFGVAAAAALAATRVPPIAALVVWDTVTIAGGLGAWWGKSAFAASYAEDRLAGMVWYCGWIVACAGCAAAIYCAARLVSSRAKAVR